MTTQETPRREERPRVMPSTDVFETDEAVTLAADMPGADESSIELTLTEDVLTLRGRPVELAPGDPSGAEDAWKLEWAEYLLPDYERTFRLATDIDRDRIAATIQEGTLRVTLPKRKPATNRIEVRSG